jgi:hypothetical protein
VPFGKFYSTVLEVLLFAVRSLFQWAVLGKQAAFCSLFCSRWPDVFTTYSADYMTQLLKGAAIYSTPTAGNKYYEYVIIRSDATAFEIWH